MKWTKFFIILLACFTAASATDWDYTQSIATQDTVWAKAEIGKMPVMPDSCPIPPGTHVNVYGYASRGAESAKTTGLDSDLGSGRAQVGADYARQNGLIVVEIDDRFGETGQRGALIIINTTTQAEMELRAFFADLESDLKSAKEKNVEQDERLSMHRNAILDNRKKINDLETDLIDFIVGYQCFSVFDGKTDGQVAFLGLSLRVWDGGHATITGGGLPNFSDTRYHDRMATAGITQNLTTSFSLMVEGFWQEEVLNTNGGYEQHQEVYGLNLGLGYSIDIFGKQVSVFGGPTFAEIKQYEYHQLEDKHFLPVPFLEQKLGGFIKTEVNL